MREEPAAIHRKPGTAKGRSPLLTRLKEMPNGYTRKKADYFAADMFITYDKEHVAMAPVA